MRTDGQAWRANSRLSQICDCTWKWQRSKPKITIQSTLPFATEPYICAPAVASAAQFEEHNLTHITAVHTHTRTHAHTQVRPARSAKAVSTDQKRTKHKISLQSTLQFTMSQLTWIFCQIHSLIYRSPAAWVSYHVTTNNEDFNRKSTELHCENAYTTKSEKYQHFLWF